MESNGADGDSSPTDKANSTTAPCYKSLTIEPTDTQIFTHQVAGHNTADVAVLKHKNGFLMKIWQNDSRGQRELEFYRKVYDTSDNPCSTELRHRLQKFTPTFFGLSNMVVNGVQKHYLMLHDLLNGMTKPCVMDLKIGVVTSNPEASPAKIEQEKSKYRATKEALGVSLAGMSHFDIHKNEFIRKERHYGRTLTPVTLPNTIKEFLNFDHVQSRVLAHQILLRLQAIADMFKFQNEFAFYSSSILIAYDAATVFRNLESTQDLKEFNKDEFVRVFMIDFAHVFPLPNGTSRDDNYLFGLKNVIHLFQQVLI